MDTKSCPRGAAGRLCPSSTVYTLWTLTFRFFLWTWATHYRRCSCHSSPLGWWKHLFRPAASAPQGPAAASCAPSTAPTAAAERPRAPAASGSPGPRGGRGPPAAKGGPRDWQKTEASRWWEKGWKLYVKSIFDGFSRSNCWFTGGELQWGDPPSFLHLCGGSKERARGTTSMIYRELVYMVNPLSWFRARIY